MSEPKDPMRSFAGVMSGVLILEAIVVLLALPWVAKLGGGVATWQGILIGACAFVRRPFGIPLVIALQVVMIGCVFAVTALGVLGVIFGAVWGYLLWIRHDVATRMREGTLPSQQSTEDG